MDTKIEFIYLSEQDTIDLGILDAPHWVDIDEEVFKILANGDYLMGGPNHNSHGMPIVFPKETPFPNMPVAGPDRRFVAMPGYLGGRFDVCGVKWYGSNAANTSKGLPRSILTVILNDKDTGAPLAHISANLISAVRTGAVPAVATRHLARPDSEVMAVIGCGPINKSCFRHIVTQAKNIKKVYCYDIFEEKSQAFADYAAKEFGFEGIATNDLQLALKDADLVTVAASRLKPLYIENDWIKAGATVLLTGPATGNEDLWLKNRIVLDHEMLHEAYVEEAIASGDKEGYYKGIIGGPIYSLIDAGKLPPLKEFADMGNVILGNKPNRESDDEIIIFVACGMAVYDLACAYELWQRALERKVGQTLLLWDKPALG